MGRIIGIDLGTTKSVVGVMIGGRPSIIPDRYGQSSMPSLVLVTPEENIFAGGRAKRHPEFYTGKSYTTICSVKRLMGRRGEISWGRLKTHPQEISAFILAELKSQAERYLGEKVDKAVITVPSSFNENQRRATKEAGEIAGLEVVRLINEPTAAAFAYGIDRSDKELKIMVFDFGGGTLDVTIADCGGGIFQVKSTSGDTQLGGQDMDEVLLNYVISEFKKEQGIDLSSDKMATQRLRKTVEEAKIELSSVLETQINLPFISADATGPKHLVMNITRAKLESLVESIVKRCSEPMEKAISDAGLTPQQIDKIILVGGVTRMPIVLKFIFDYTGKKPEGGVDPMECVAMGAAIQAGIIEGNVKNVVLVDVVPLSLGIETLGGRFTKMIGRNSAIPTTETHMFTTTSDNQTQIEINVLQGESPLANDNTSIGRFILQEILPAPRGLPQVEVTFSVDENGILNVSAKDKATGKVQKIVGKSPYGLNDAQIKIMKQKLKSWSSEMSILELKHSVSEFGSSINELLTKGANALEWDDISLLKKCSDSLNSLLKKQTSETEIEESISAVKSIYEKALEKLSSYEIMIKKINTLTEKIDQLTTEQEAIGDNEANMLPQGKKLLKDAVSQNFTFEMLKNIYSSVYLGYKEAKADLIKRTLDDLEMTSYMQSWLIDSRYTFSNFSSLNEHLSRLNEFKENKFIIDILKSEDSESQKFITQRVLDKIKGNMIIKDYFLLITTMFVEPQISPIFEEPVDSDEASNLQSFTLLYALDNKKNIGQRESIAKIIAEKFLVIRNLPIVIDLITLEAEGTVKQYLLNYLDRQPTWQLQNFFSNADPATKRKISNQKEILIRLAKEPDEEIVLFALKSIDEFYPEELIPLYAYFLNNRNLNIRIEILKLLISAKDNAQVLDIFNQSLSDSSSEIQLLALEFIEKNKEVTSIPYLFGLLKSEQNQAVKEKIITILSELDNKKAICGLFEFLTDQNQNIRALAVSTIQKHLDLIDNDYIKLFNIIRNVTDKKQSLSIIDRIFLKRFSKKHSEMKEVLQTLGTWANNNRRRNNE
jgi:molecular chaperone DnaK